MAFRPTGSASSWWKPWKPGKKSRCPSALSRTGTKSSATASRNKCLETNHIGLVRRIPVGKSRSRHLTAARRPSEAHRRAEHLWNQECGGTTIGSRKVFAIRNGRIGAVAATYAPVGVLPDLSARSGADRIQHASPSPRRAVWVAARGRRWPTRWRLICRRSIVSCKGAGLVTQFGEPHRATCVTVK